MKEEEPNWFVRCEEELPSPEELMPLSQTLITPDLAFAFDIPSPNSNQNHHQNSHGHQTPPRPPTLTQSPSQTPSSLQQQQQQNHHLGGDHDSSEMGGGGGSGSGGGAAGGGDEQARTLKRPRLVWTPQLHKRFVDAVSHLGIKHAVPKTIMQLMSVDGLTRENVASHLQKYRLYLKRMQGISSGAAHAAVSHSDAATEQLFASSPIPHHFLNHQRPAVGAGGGGGPEQFMPFVPVAALQHHQQMAAAAAAAAAHQQQQYFQHRQMGSLGSPPGGGFEHGGFLGRQQQHRQTGIQRVIGPMTIGMAPPMPSSNFVGDSDSGAGGGGRKVLTLFPTND